MRYLRFISILGIALVATIIGLTAPVVANTINIPTTNNDTKVTNLNINVRPGQIATAIADTTVDISSISTPYMVYAYIDDSNILQNTFNPFSNIIATDPTTSLDPNDLTLNSYGVRAAATGGFVPVSTDAKHPTLLYSSDTATIDSTIDIIYGTKVDDTIAVGIYTNANTSQRLRYVTEAQHTYTLKFASEGVPAFMPSDQSYGPAPILTYDFTIPSDTTNIPQRSGYTFTGWCNGAVGIMEGNATCDGSIYQPGDTITLDIDSATEINTTATLYAMWNVNTHTITYDLDGGTAGIAAPTTGIYDNDIQIDNPTKENYIFQGWEITGMDNSIHYYGDSASSYATSTATALSGITATHFKNLRTSSGVVAFKAVWKKKGPTTFDDAYNAAGKIKVTASDGKQYYKMQDMNTSICSAVAKPTSVTAKDEQTTTLVDARKKEDGTIAYQTYTVGKLADGNCWMTQDLALGRAATTTTIYSTDSDITTENYTLPASSSNWPTSTYSTPKIYYGASDKIYYNFNVATAGTIDGSVASGEAAGSIWPKGWKLPTGGSGSQFDTVYTTYGNASNMNAALRLTSAGYFNPSDKAVSAGGSYWWSSTSRLYDYAYRMISHASLVKSDGYDVRTLGYSIRCIAR